MNADEDEWLKQVRRLSTQLAETIEGNRRVSYAARQHCARQVRGVNNYLEDVVSERDRAASSHHKGVTT